MDISSTILYNLRLPVPEGMDGRVLKDIFTSEFQGDAEKRYGEEDLAWNVTDGDKSAYSSDEEVEIRSRLQDLGYFD
jgi:hypothetical protein